MAMVNKAELPGICLTVAIVFTIAAGMYAAGRYDGSRPIKQLVDVRCERTTVFSSLSGGAEPTFHRCDPGGSVKFDGDHGVILVLP